MSVKVAAVADAPIVARLLEAFNCEFGTPTTGSAILAQRLLAGPDVIALPAAAETVTRERGGELAEINVDGNDVDARRFYQRHGYRT